MIDGKCVVFTGKMETGIRKEMMELVAKHGGTTSNHVTRDTNILVVGIYKASLCKGNISKKRSLVDKYNSQGYNIAIMSEKDFLLEL